MRKRGAGSVWMILPLYLFTLIFVALPLLYVIALSFFTADGGYGVNWKFTLDNYKQILEPVYLQTFTGSFRLAITSTLIICLVGYPFGYFMAKLSEGKKKLAMLFLMLPFWVNSLIRLYGWIIILQKKGLLNYLLMKLGIIQEPLKILYSYPRCYISDNEREYYKNIRLEDAKLGDNKVKLARRQYRGKGLYIDEILV